ncbi:Do family serine endopeptidase [Asticcacaulis sp. AC466]|uniref:Do family serine endopeptidase n=1 Tax=Asticcacaulis sp. AC466 TaxID=1282362 RepID=UPI0004CF476C|nr:Do family serine endopeptidase [Asticcacaulis sp. AC466]
MGNWNFKALLKNRSAIGGAVAGLVLGAGVAGAAITGFGDHRNGYDGASLIKTADLTPVKPPVGAPMSFADLIQRVSPAVVSIETRGKMKIDTGIPSLPGFSFPGQDDGKQREQEVRGAGSGFFVSADGFVVTNNHVIEGADEIIVKLTNDKELPAKVVGRDIGTDLAVLKVEGNDFPFVRWELEKQPRVGDWVIAVGNPFNFSNTATAGIVSAYGRDLRDSAGGPDYTDYLQIDAAINRGNSGGPTFDLYGKVIGVNTAIVTPSGANAGVGFAIPSDVAYKITTQLMKGQAIARGYIGILIQPVTKENAEALGITDLTGAYVTETTQGGPADKAGLDIGDIVKSVNGASVKSPTELTRRIADVKVGEKVKLGVLRNGKIVEVTVTAALRPSEDELNKKGLNGLGGSDDSSSGSSSSGTPVIGLSVKAITPDVRRDFGIGADVKGVVITDLDGDSDAAQKGLKPGDVIVRADNKPVTTQGEFSAIIDGFKKAGRPSILLMVNRDGRNVALPLSLKDTAGAKK